MIMFKLKYVLVGLLMLFSSFLLGFQQVGTEKHVSIIIDDLGNNQKGTKEIFAIKAPLTVAIMPFLRSSKEDALRARKSGFEVLLHLPMEFQHGKQSWLGPGSITTNMSTEAIKRQVREDLASVPNAVGVNNHMGSKATADVRVVRAVLEVIKERHLFVVDSVTSPDSKILELAKELGVPYTKRTIFLDNVNSQADIEKQLRKLIKETQEQGNGVAIGHVGPQGLRTSRAIVSMLPNMKAAGIKLVPVSRLVHH
jgi:uncharacterized protein